jgi:hypothetical protein
MRIDEMSENVTAEPGVLVARAGSYYRRTRYLMALLLVGMGAWFAYDGWVKYPAENRAFLDSHPLSEAPHQPLDLLLQRGLGFALPPLGILLLAWALYNSRGQYKLEGNTLEVPGHPPVPLDAITKIDKTLWDRKGVAYLDYALASGQKGRLRLDDFVYERTGTDAIYERIEKAVLPPDAGSPEPGQDAASE